MFSKKFFVRLLPFIATFLVGVFIASFFVTLGRPGRVGHRHRHYEKDRQIRMERDQYREENIRLKELLNDRQMNGDRYFSDSEIQGLLPPPPPLAVKPHSPKVIR